MLQTLLQSYQNVSNSQLEHCIVIRSVCCKRFCKVIKMLAIHNYKIIDKIFGFVANAFAKLSKCQQFTTTKLSLTIIFKLQTLLQSYQNVSNSQPNKISDNCENSCKRFCKVIKMLAIHNCYTAKATHTRVANAFAKLSKCQQFTTIDTKIKNITRLQTLLQSYQNVSNSQPPSARAFGT